MSEIRVLVNGSQGRMGQESVKAIQETAGLVLAGEADQGDPLEQKIAESQAQVVVDFTTASAVYENTKHILNTEAYPVIGTSGLLPGQIEELQQIATEKQRGGLIAPNFAIGAVLMMKYAKEAARYFDNVEIIELHHDRKADAPSGTAIKTAEMIHESRRSAPPINPNAHEILPGARGASSHDIPIHSIRLPGLVAHQEVIFGGTGETFTLRHDSIHRESFMSGVCLACHKVLELKELIYGLENIL